MKMTMKYTNGEDDTTCQFVDCRIAGEDFILAVQFRGKRGGRGPSRFNLRHGRQRFKLYFGAFVLAD